MSNNSSFVRRLSDMGIDARGVSSDIPSSFPTVADIPASFEGVARVGGDLYVGDGRQVIPQQKNDVASRLKGLVSTDNLMESAASGINPTFTVGADYAGSTVPGWAFYPVSHAFIYKSAPIKVAYNDQGRDVFAFKSGDYGAANDAGASGFCTIVTDAQIIEFDTQCQPTFLLTLIVDGRRIADTGQLASVASGLVRKVIKVDFGSVKLRKISWSFNGNFAGIFIHNKYQLYPVQQPMLSMLCMEDSYGGGGYYDFNLLSTMQDVAGAIGAQGVATSAIGGTGYINRGNGNYRTAYERLRGFVEAGHLPDIVATPLGINDMATPDATIRAALEQYYGYIRDNLHNSLCISLGCQAPQANQVVAQPGYGVVTNAIRDVLAASGCSYIFINPLNGSIHTSWGIIQDNSTIQASYANHPNAMITGSSYVGDPAPSGNSALYIDADRTHPSQAAVGAGAAGLSYGRAYFSKYVINAVRQALSAY